MMYNVHAERSEIVNDSITTQNTSQNLNSKKPLSAENKILRISFVGSTLFLLSEVLAAVFTHSQAVLMDCVYDLVDLAMLGPFMILVPKLYKPLTEKWPYGFAQIESLFVVIKCGLLLFLDIGLLIDSIKLILSGGHIVNAGAIAAFELFISVTCAAMYFIFKHMKRNFSSPTIDSELYIWKLDAYSTGGVGLAFLIQLLLQKTALAWLVPYIDPFIAATMAAILAKEPICMVLDALKSLLLIAPKKDILEDIRSKANNTLKELKFDIDFLDVVKTGRKIWINVYISQDDDMISISLLKQAHDKIVADLESQYEDIFVELIPELKPKEVQC